MATFPKKLMLAIAALLVLQTLVVLLKYIGFVTGEGRFAGDFRFFWKAAEHVYAGDIAAIYAPEHWRIVIAEGRIKDVHWFVYPPYALFGLWPLGSFSFSSAALIWMLAPLPLCAALTALLVRRSVRSHSEAHQFGSEPPLPLITAVSLAYALPLLGFHIVAAQTGAIMAILFMSVALCWRHRPILAGVLIGLMSIKPQMGLLIPIALVAAGRWQTIAAATATIAVLMASVTLWLGAGIWRDYFAITQIFAELIGGGHDGVKNMALAPYVSLLAIGMPKLLASAIAGICSMFAAVVIFQIFKARPGDGRDDLRLAILAVATLFATPYALSYDMPILILALVPLIVRAWLGRADVVDIVVMVAIVAAPVGQLALAQLGIPFGFIALTGWLFVLLRRYVEEGPQTASTAVEPTFGKALSTPPAAI